MTNPHAMTITTYHSVNADSGKQWLAFLVLPSGRLPMTFFAASEAEAHSEAKAFWDGFEAEREENHRRREEGRRKAAETRARKSQRETA